MITSFDGDLETLKLSMSNLISFNTVNLIQEIDSTYKVSIFCSQDQGVFVGCFVDFNNIFCIEYLASAAKFEAKSLPIFDSNGDECRL